MFVVPEIRKVKAGAPLFPEVGRPDGFRADGPQGLLLPHKGLSAPWKGPVLRGAASGLFPSGPGVPWDPRGMGYDGLQYDGEGEYIQETQLLDYASGGGDSVELTKKGLITALLLVADPYRHSVTTATQVTVQDAVDKVLSGLSISGGSTYFSLNSTLVFLKALSNLNKSAYHGLIMHEDLATPVAADNDSRQAWYIHFGFLNDHDKYDISSGIPAELLTSLILSGTFGTSQLIATVAANGTIQAATDIYVVTFTVQGIPKEYYVNMPIPQFEHDHIPTPITNSRFNLKPDLALKRTTLVNLGVAASNNEPRNDSNITDMSLVFEKPKKHSMSDRVRWQLEKAIGQLDGGVEVDRDGSGAVQSAGLDGVRVIDWRRVTKNPLGLNLLGVGKENVHLDFTMATLTGSIHAFHEYYNLPDPSVLENWPAWVPN